jgi:hypothetical protein
MIGDIHQLVKCGRLHRIASFFVVSTSWVKTIGLAFICCTCQWRFYFRLLLKALFEDWTSSGWNHDLTCVVRHDNDNAFALLPSSRCWFGESFTCSLSIVNGAGLFMLLLFVDRSGGIFLFYFPFWLYASYMSRLVLLLQGWIYVVYSSYLICLFYQREMNSHCNFIDVTWDTTDWYQHLSYTVLVARSDSFLVLKHDTPLPYLKNIGIWHAWRLPAPLHAPKAKPQ